MSRTNVASNVWFRRPFYVYNNGVLAYSEEPQVDHNVLFRNSYVTPGFKTFKKLSRSSTSQLPMLPYEYNMRRENIATYGQWSAVSLTDPSQSFLESGAVYYLPGASPKSPWQPDDDLISELRNQNIQKVLGKLKDQKVNLGQVYAERKMTASLIGDTAKQLASAFLHLKKGDYRGAGAALGVAPSRFKTAKFNSEYKVDKWKAAANGWLSYQYGWQPLLQDVYGSAEWLASKQSREIRGVERSKLTRKFKLSEVELNPLADVTNEQTARYDSSLVVWFATTGVELADVKEAGFTNPALLAWELLPYSFVVDWFIPIGDYISSLDATLGLTFEKGAFTYFLDSVSRSSGYAENRVIYGYGYYPGRHNVLAKGNSKTVYCIREPITVFPSPVLPSFKNPLSFSHATSAISLLIQTFKR